MKLFRIIVAGALTATALGVFGPVAAGANGPFGGFDAAQNPNQTLGALGKRHDLRMGTAVDINALANDATYADKVGSEFTAVSPENAFKWSEIEKVRGTLDFSGADRLVDFAIAHHQKIHGHTLLWHNQLPTWLTTGVADGTISADELRNILRQHVFDEVRHFGNKVWQWDVVNEVVNDNNPAGLRDTIWLQKLGPGYIADMFRWAHQANPRVQLFLNDYNIEGLNAKSDKYYQIVQDLQAAHVHVDGLGIQGHLSTTFPPPMNATENFKRFDALGLKTAVTEADVRSDLPPIAGTNPVQYGPASATENAAQSEGFSVLLQACLLTRHCVLFTLWGFTDKYQWVPGVFTGQGSAAPFDANFQPKAAYRQMQLDLALATGPKHRDD
jgi:endo-1,4-beta-xylanase